MTRARTLRGRVSLLGLAVIAGWLFVLAAGFDIVLALRVNQQIDDALQVRAQAASATVDISKGRVVGVRESVTDAALDNSIWVYSTTRALERPRAPAELQRAADSLAGTTVDFADRAGHRLHVLPLLDDEGTRVGTVVSALDLTPYDRTKNVAILGSIVVAVLLLAGVYPALRYVAGRALRPVAEMSTQAAQWGGNSPVRRFGEGQRYAELRWLAANLDALLARLAASLRHERHLSAELSHELRTPLARITTHVDLMRADVPAELQPDLDELQANCAAMDRIIDSLLAAARTELSSAAGRCDVAPVLTALVARHGDADGPQVTVAPTDAVAGVDGDVLERILAPILDNARRHASTGIDVVAARRDQSVVVEIGNDGPVVPAEHRDAIFEPGFRIDPTRAGDGAGLGLALSRRLARSADGDVTLRLDDGRTVFVVTVPAG